jgi:integrase
VRMRGSIDELPSGALRVRVYAGRDPLTKGMNYLTEVVPAGPTAMREAEKLRTRLLNQIDEQRQPRTKATVNQLLDRYLEVLHVDPNTEKGYRGYVDNHIRPVMGELPISKVNGELVS